MRPIGHSLIAWFLSEILIELKLTNGTFQIGHARWCTKMINQQFKSKSNKHVFHPFTFPQWSKILEYYHTK